MSTGITPTTELEAVNTILANIGETETNSLEDETFIDALTARKLLTSVTRELQTRSWFWNTDVERKMQRNLQGEIIVAANTMSIQPAGVDRGLSIVQRGSRLYDRKNHTYNFDKDITCTITIALPFDEMPESARRFATLRAARMFQEQTLSSESLAQGDRIDEGLAYAALLNDHVRVAGFSYLTGSPTSRDVMMRRRV